SSGPKFTTAHGLKVCGYIYDSFANTAKFDNATVVDSGQAYSGTVTFNASSALGIGVEVHQVEMDAWGWAAGLSYDFKREITSAMINYNGTSIIKNTSYQPSIEVL